MPYDVSNEGPKGKVQGGKRTISAQYGLYCVLQWSAPVFTLHK